MMPLWGIVIAVAVAGLIGGLASAYHILNRSLLDEDKAVAEGASPTTTRQVVSTYLGNGFLGAVAGCVSWAAYGAYSAESVFSEGELTLVTLAGAFFLGMGGTKWLESERDKGRWQAAAYQVAVTTPDPELQATLSLASSDQAVAIAKAAATTESGEPEMQGPRSRPGTTRPGESGVPEGSGEARPGGSGAGIPAGPGRPGMARPGVPLGSGGLGVPEGSEGARPGVSAGSGVPVGPGGARPGGPGMARPGVPGGSGMTKPGGVGAPGAVRPDGSGEPVMTRPGLPGGPAARPGGSGAGAARPR